MSIFIRVARFKKGLHVKTGENFPTERWIGDFFGENKNRLLIYAGTDETVFARFII